ncbi:cobalamin biosynthesis protein [Pseudonocardia acaciae]|uniref:cobalamin biosynthesis protein n=1 Tax=Pseudonocardia acaciae TaxID=551276 RepID=UPI000688A541|nr:cobalamin biosynthesis protein [Pseudonocardia acaciae]
MARARARAVGLLLGVAADAVFADPARWHPVAGFGRLAARLERRWYADSRLAGVGHLAACAGAAVGVGAVVGRAVARRPALETVAVAAATWTVLGGASLAGEASALARALDAGDLPAARARIPRLCGRDPNALDAAGMARAGCESVAENTSDAVVAPLLWGAVAGIPGLLGYRAVNTLDAMVGYRSPRYGRFGWAAARADDLANLVPARLTAALTVAAAPLLAGPGSPAAAVRAWRRDARAHPSPNAGPVEATAAGALGVRLGGPTRYAHGTERRPTLGEGAAPTPADLRRAARLSRLLGWSAAVVATVLGHRVTRACRPARMRSVLIRRSVRR